MWQPIIKSFFKFSVFGINNNLIVYIIQKTKAAGQEYLILKNGK